MFAKMSFFRLLVIIHWNLSALFLTMLIHFIVREVLKVTSSNSGKSLLIGGVYLSTLKVCLHHVRSHI